MTLLVTSAKAGEGKSTTALNLAATCARAGERTLLMDVDLRRPSLARGLPRRGRATTSAWWTCSGATSPGSGRSSGPTSPTSTSCPTGDTRDIPIEILGTLELRQLLIALSQPLRPRDPGRAGGPGPGRLPDARPRSSTRRCWSSARGRTSCGRSQRAKAMLEQSHVVIAGVVFNGLYEDLENWSSYGPNEPYGVPRGHRRRGPDAGRAGGLAAPSDEHAALPAAGSARA